MKNQCPHSTICLQATDLPRIVIIGAGFVGINLIKRLRNKPVQLVLLDKNNFHQFQPSLYQQVEDLKEKRFYFSLISEVLYCTFKNFDLELGDIHLAYCSMALNNKGAYWLTDNHKIRNPYFGDKMLKCGSIVEIFP